MILRLLFLSMQLAIILLATLLAFNNTLIDSYFWIVFCVITVFSLPFIINKVIFGGRFLGTRSFFLFLYYPFFYCIIFFLAKTFNSNIFTYTFAFQIINIIIWNLLLLLHIVLSPTQHIKYLAKSLLLVFIPIAITSLFLILTTRSPDSVVATDYIQHQAVINASFSELKLCVTPDLCSNIFIKTGYTTFFHSILAYITSFSGNDLTRTFYVIDILWGILMGIVTFKITYNLFKQRTLSLFATILSMTIFINWAYEFSFFIPQTFTFFLFCILISETKTKTITIVFAIPVLFLVHFVIGTYLSIILLIKHFISRKFLMRNTTLNIPKFSIQILTILLAIFIFTNSLGITFENVIQVDDIKFIGATTNPSFPDSILNIINIISYPIVIMGFAVVHIYFSQGKHKNRLILFSLSFILINLITFFLGPTYAAKFLIGFGIFSSTLIIYYISRLNFKTFEKYVFILIIIFSSTVNFFTTYKEYLSFYDNGNGITSAVTLEDQPIISFLKKKKLNCTIISDPYTQLLIAGFTNYSTINGQYMDLELRKTLLALFTSPQKESFTDIIEFAHNSPLCFLFTSRLEASIKNNDIKWTENLYLYSLKNIYKIDDSSNVEKFFKEKGYVIKFQNDNFILFVPVSTPKK